MPPGMCLCRIVPTAAPEVASAHDDCCDHCDRSHGFDDDSSDDRDPAPLPSAPDGPNAPCAFMASAANRPPTPEPVAVRRDLTAGDAVGSVICDSPPVCPEVVGRDADMRPPSPPAFISHCSLLL